jgi:L-asparaginase
METPTLETPGAVVADVPVVHSGMGVGAGQFDRAVAAGADGVVIEGTGLGNVTAALGDAVGEVADDLPVVVASRCHAGATEPIYGTAGGGVTLADHGVTFAGGLSASKARVALVLGLSAGRSGEALRTLVGAGPSDRPEQSAATDTSGASDDADDDDATGTDDGTADG